MQITKYGHSCILLDDGETKILFDPGVYSTIPDLVVDAIVITHVHLDHIDIEKLQPLLVNNSPQIITNTEVKIELAKHGLDCQVVEEGQSVKVNTFTITAYGNEHAIMHPDLPKFQNTGYLINGQIFHPGDSLFVPPSPVNVLLLPIAAPWSKVSETLDFITATKAKVNFPIHDAFIKDGGAFYRFTNMWCEKYNLEFIQPELNKAYEI